MTGLLVAAVRATAFVRKETVEVLRQPRLLLVLVLGPFLILLVFGAGLRDVDPPLRTVFVAPAEDDLAREVREFAETQSERLEIEGITQDERAAVRRLRAGEVQLVVVFPEDVEERVRSGEQSVITLYHNEMDPIEGRAIFLFMRDAIAQTNQQILASVVEQGQADSDDLLARVRDARDRVEALREATRQDDDTEARVELAGLRADTAGLVLAAGPAAAVIDGASGRAADPGGEESLYHLVAQFAQDVDELDDSGDVDEDTTDELDGDLETIEEALTDFRSIPPDVLVSPFRGESARVDGRTVELGDFYAPGVVVVLLQHLLITLVSLSVVHERELGTPDLYRVAPLRVGELVAGKYLAHMLLGALVAALLIGALVVGLGVPMAGNWLTLALIVLAVLFASAGLGFCVAGVARTDAQAVQYTMLLLLVTIFFSGFILSLERFFAGSRWVGFLVPATYGVRLLRDEMLRGVITQPLYLVVLVLFGVALALAGSLAARWRLRPA